MGQIFKRLELTVEDKIKIAKEIFPARNSDVCSPESCRPARPFSIEEASEVTKCMKGRKMSSPDYRER